MNRFPRRWPLLLALCCGPLSQGISGGKPRLEAGALATEQRDDAVRTAESWLVLLDAGKFRASWDAASELLQNRVSEPRWREVIRAVRESLGDVRHRKLLKARHARSLPGLPDGDYLVIDFATEFDRKTNAVETVTPALTDDGDWKISGYYVR